MFGSLCRIESEGGKAAMWMVWWEFLECCRENFTEHGDGNGSVWCLERNGSGNSSPLEVLTRIGIALEVEVGISGPHAGTGVPKWYKTELASTGVLFSCCRIADQFWMFRLCCAYRIPFNITYGGKIVVSGAHGIWDQNIDNNGKWRYIECKGRAEHRNGSAWERGTVNKVLGKKRRAIRW